MQKILFGLFISLMILAVSCTKKQPDLASTQIGNTATVKMNNGWWINVSIKGQSGNLFPTPVFFETYNTASNSPDSLWIDDLGNFWDFKVVATANYSALTFAANQVFNNYYADTVTITNGKILPKAGHSRAGNVTDSLYLEASFSDDVPAFGNTYIIAGTARTGFDE
ncbi:MAG TPA: lipid-binding protein, partial [Puia sp.]|nr:lipid-binding protein [Puia sp.]